MTMNVVPSTYLFCPGNRPDRFQKALQSGAPGIIIDLEDAVPESEKDTARRDTLTWLGTLVPAVDGPQVALRISSPTSPSGLEDLYAVVHSGALPALHTLVLPKVADASEVRILAAQLLRGAPQRRLIPLIETPGGVRAVSAIAQAHPAVSAIGFGAADFCVEAGVAFEWEALLQVRSRLVFDCAGTGVGLLDVPYLDLADDDGLRRECARVKALGFLGKLAIHPRQVAAIVESFAPGASELAWAAKVVAGFEAAGHQACAIDGRMVDEPVYLSALRITLRAG